MTEISNSAQLNQHYPTGLDPRIHDLAADMSLRGGMSYGHAVSAIQQAIHLGRAYGHGLWPQRCPWCAAPAVAWYPDQQPREYACRTEFHHSHYRTARCRLRTIARRLRALSRPAEPTTSKLLANTNLVVEAEEGTR